MTLPLDWVALKPRILKMRKQGIGWNSIGVVLGCSRVTVWKIANDKWKRPDRSERLPVETIRAMQKAFADGETVSCIAKRMHMGWDTADAYIRCSISLNHPAPKPVYVSSGFIRTLSKQELMCGRA